VLSIGRYHAEYTWQTKDTLNTRMDLEEMKLRKDLHHRTLENGSKKTSNSLRNCLHGIKVPIGYSDNVSRLVNVNTLKVHFKKSNDYHILIGQFLPNAIRGILLFKV
jgi:hypothetical protein